jgi:hypothetical protein
MDLDTESGSGFGRASFEVLDVLFLGLKASLEA